MVAALTPRVPNIDDIGLMLKAARSAEASKESEIRIRFARDVAAPLLAEALGAKRVWVFGSSAKAFSRSDSDIDILVEGGDGLSTSKRLNITYDIISNLKVPRKRRGSSLTFQHSA